MEIDEDLSQLAHLARWCNHVYEEGVCKKCGWERGSHAKVGRGGVDPNPLAAIPVSTSFSGPPLSSPFFCVDCRLEFTSRALASLHEIKGHVVEKQEERREP